jgi:hypothetical protein
VTQIQNLNNFIIASIHPDRSRFKCKYHNAVATFYSYLLIINLISDEEGQNIKLVRFNSIKATRRLFFKIYINITWKIHSMHDGNVIVTLKAFKPTFLGAFLVLDLAKAYFNFKCHWSFHVTLSTEIFIEIY